MIRENQAEHHEVIFGLAKNKDGFNYSLYLFQKSILDGKSDMNIIN